jgi:predicted PilT family ATPase
MDFVLLLLLNLRMASIGNKGESHKVARAAIDAKAVGVVSVSPTIPQIADRNGFLQKGQAKDVLNGRVICRDQLLDVKGHYAYY